MISNDIKIRFRNESNDCQPLNVLFFQKEVVVGFDEIAYAWRVVKNCPTGGYNDLVYPIATAVNTVDPDNNHTAKLPAVIGNIYQLAFDECSGNQLSLVGSGAPADISVQNNLAMGSIDVNLYKDGKLLTTKQNVIPGDMADFQLHPKLYVGTATNVSEGEQLSSAILKSNNTEFDLTGIRSLDIVMFGGGKDGSAVARSFRAENIVYG